MIRIIRNFIDQVTGANEINELKAAIADMERLSASIESRANASLVAKF